jgi:site-specific recombinase XerD
MKKPGIRIADYSTYIEDYLSLRLHMNHQESSIIAARKDLHMFLRYCSENDVACITGSTMLDYMAWLRNLRNNCSGTINRKLSSLRMYIRHLSLRGITEARSIPVKDVPRARDPYRGPIQTLEFKEIIKLLTSIDKKSVIGMRNYTLFSLIYALGLRLSEALNINLHDIDLKEKLLIIHGKGAKVRKLPITDQVERLLLDWIALRKALLNAQCEKALFLSKKGARLSLRMAEHAFSEIIKPLRPLSIERIVPHTLRHAFASHAIDGEADVLVLKNVLGHASIKTTELYLHPSILTLRKAVSDHIASDILAELKSHRKGVFRIQHRNTG